MELVNCRPSIAHHKARTPQACHTSSIMQSPRYEDAPEDQYAPWGTVLEAAFVDPAYQWPPAEGEGRNAIELQASISLLDENDSVCTTDSQRKRMEIPPKPEAIKKRWWKFCCQSNDAAIASLKDYEKAKKMALEARKAHHMKKKIKEKEFRKRNKYNRVPEGILIYRLDTSNQVLTLMSPPHNNTDVENLVTEMVVTSARPSPDKSRRGMILTGMDGTKATLVACEQRTAIAWLEAIDLMLANKGRLGDNVSSILWGKCEASLRYQLSIFVCSLTLINSFTEWNLVNGVKTILVLVNWIKLKANT